VFWRVLLATAGVYRALMVVADRNAPNSAPLSVTQLLAIPESERASFDWREDAKNAEDGDAINQAHAVVSKYLNRMLAQIVERDLAAMAQAKQAGIRH
jgi:predicted sugar kinase